MYNCEDIEQRPRPSEVDKSTHFKMCPMCGATWPTRDRFIQDPALEVIGYQACFEDLKEGIIMFNHACKGTLAVQAGKFWGLYQGPIHLERATGSDQCPGYCLLNNELAPCTAHCECAHVREILQIIKDRSKKPGAFIAGQEAHKR